MALDVEDVAKQVFDAIKGSLGSLDGEAAAAVKQEARDLANALKDIAVDRASGAIDDATAKSLLTAQTKVAQAAMEAEAAIAAAKIRPALKAGLGALANAALSAIGIGWAKPILDEIIAGL
jgi:hypothetical protein